MSFDYAEIALDADELLQEFGAAATITIYGGGTYTGGAVTPSQTVIPVTACVFGYPAHLIDGTHVQQGDEQALVSAVGLTVPKAGDRFTWQGVARTIISVKPTAPNGTLVLCELQVRK